MLSKIIGKKSKITRKVLPCILTMGLVFTGVPVASAQGTQTSAGQEKLTKDQEIIQSVISKIDIDYGYNIAKDVSLMGSGELGFRTAGSDAEKQAADYIEKKMKDLGLSNVRQDKVPVDAWTFRGASLRVTNGSGEDKTMTLSSYAGSVGTDEKGISGEIVYIGDGSLAGYEGKDVKDKIVLAEFDMNDDYWVTQPSYQAELKGAKAFIIAYNGQSYGTRPDALNSFDVISRDAIPIMNMSRNDAAYLKDLLQKGTVNATLVSNVELNKVDGESCNVIGEIPGKMKDKYILLGAHYDGYFHAFQDDILGVGVFMSVAKALLDSGYQPEHTIIFTAFGSEEYGITNSHYDWVRGSWYQINHNTPEWAGNMMMFLNFDTQRPDMEEFVINSTPEYGQFFEKYAMTMNLPNPWTKGVVVKGTNGPWSDDYNFISAGVPGLITGKGNTEWKFQSYHTNYDTYEIYNPETFRFNVENYIGMTLAFDRLIMAPLNFSGLMTGSLETLDKDVLNRAGLSADELTKVSQQFIADSEKDYQLIQEANQLYSRLKQLNSLGIVSDEELLAYKNRLLENRAIGMEAYKVLEKDFTKLDSWDVVMYGHEIAQNDFDCINQAKTALQKQDSKASLEALTGTQFGWILPKFEKEVYRYWGIEAINPQRDDIYWGTGKTLAVIDLFDVYQSIVDKQAKGNTDFTAELAILNAKEAEAKNALSQILTSETTLVKKAHDLTKQYDLTECIAEANQTVTAAYAKLPAEQSVQNVTSETVGYEAILGMTMDGILAGGEAFVADEPVTRAEFASWLAKAFQLPTNVAAAGFTDVKAESLTNVNYINAVAKAGLMEGDGAKLFMPQQPLTNKQLADVAEKLLGDSEEAAATLNALGIDNLNAQSKAAVSKAEACAALEAMRYAK